MAEVVQIDLQVTGAGEVEQSVRRVQGAIGDLGGAIGRLGAIADLGFIVVALQQTARAFGALSGVGAFAEIEQLGIGFRTLTGDAEQAAEILERVRAIGAETRFNTNDVAQFARGLLAAGIGGEELYDTLNAVLDLTAGLGVARADFERFTFNLLQLRAGGATAADVRQMLSAAPGIGMALGRELGLERPLTIGEISALMAERGGEGFFDLLIQASRQFEGAARSLTVLDAWANLQEQIGNALIPTGQLFANLLAFATRLLAPLIGALARINRALGGVPGALLALTVAAVGLAAAFRTASASSVGRTVSDALAAIAALFLLGRARLAGAIGTLRNLGVAGALRAVFGGIVNLLMRFRVGLAAIGLPLLAEWLAGQVQNQRLAGFIRDLGAFGGVGAGIGGAIGSIIPGLGTALGALIGGAIGAIVASIKTIFFPAQARAATPEQRTAENTARMAQALEQIRIELVGAGRRTGAFRSRFEAELALRRILELGLG